MLPIKQFGSSCKDLLVLTHQYLGEAQAGARQSATLQQLEDFDSLLGSVRVPRGSGTL